MQKLDTPGAISAADISSAESADGVIFYSYQQKTSGGPPMQAVYRRMPDGSYEPVPLERRVTGRGQLSAEAGELWLTAWDESASPKVGWRIKVPGYVAPAGPTAPGGVAPEKAEPLPNGGQPYADNARAFGSERLTASDPWDRFLGPDGFFAARLNKIILVQAQIQRVLKKAGLLE